MERFRALIGKVATGAQLTREEATHAFDKMMSLRPSAASYARVDPKLPAGGADPGGWGGCRWPGDGEPGGHYRRVDAGRR
jgi:hypothetical protein